MKKVLIFTASTGGGHNQAALVLEKELKLKGYHVVIVDLLKESSKILNLIISDGYKVLASKLPKLYGGLYKLSDREKINNKIIKSFNRLSYREIKGIIEHNSPDLIIGTHPFIVNVIGKLKVKGHINIPFISIVTDYEAHRTYVNNNVDAYITGSEYTCNSLVEKGINKNKIYPFGIPIRREFSEHNKPIVNTENKPFQVLLMGGSLGIKGMKRALKNILKSNNPLKIVVVCGKDEILRKRIQKTYKEGIDGKELIIYGFTDKISDLMDSSDVVITKPGGLTVSEAIVKNIPMIIPYLIPGQEKENAEFLVKSGVAVKIDQLKEIRYALDYFISNPHELGKMKNKMKELSQKYSIDKIIHLAEDLMTEYNYIFKLSYK